MISLIQRVSEASVRVQNEIVGQIKQGLLVFVAIEKTDDAQLVQKMLHKLLNYRVFSDANGKMNLSVKDVAGELLLVSQFTLAADTHKGLRPSFSGSAEPQMAKKLFAELVEQCQLSGLRIATGQFAADMQVSLVNDGPVTFWLKV